MKIIKRAEWNARAPKGSIATTTWAKRVGLAIHHSVTDTDATVRGIQAGDMDDDGFSDIGYNFLVDQDGRIYEGRKGSWSAVGAHAGGQNTAWIGVCWIGDARKVEPSAAARRAIRWLYDEACRKAGRKLQYRGHGQVPDQSTECPGPKLRAWIADGMPTTGAPSKPTAPKPSKPPTGTPAPGPRFDFPLPRGFYFGRKGGPDASVSGFYGRKFAGKTDREWIKAYGSQLGKRGWSLTRYLPSGNDGFYGQQYEGLTEAFQRDQDLPVTGRVDKATWTAAFENPVT
jgi:hypothetical protein